MVFDDMKALIFNFSLTIFNYFLLLGKKYVILHLKKKNKDYKMINAFFTYYTWALTMTPWGGRINK